MARSGQRVALLQGIAKTAPALPGPSALMHQNVTGPAPRASINEDNPTDQAQVAASILQRLPRDLTKEEREYYLAKAALEIGHT